MSVVVIKLHTTVQKVCIFNFFKMNLKQKFYQRKSEHIHNIVKLLHWYLVLKYITNSIDPT